MKNNRKAGFTLVEIMIVVAIIGLLAAIAVPSFVKARESSQQNSCINNLRQIDGAKDQWAIEENQGTDAEPDAADLDDYLKGSTSAVYCPQDSTKDFDTSYDIGDLSTSPSCNINDDHVLPNAN